MLVVLRMGEARCRGEPRRALRDWLQSLSHLKTTEADTYLQRFPTVVGRINVSLFINTLMRDEGLVGDG